MVQASVVRLGGAGAREPEAGYEAGLQQVRRIIREIDLDCSCRGTLDDALDRFSQLQAARIRRRTLRDGRRAKAAIAAVLDLLSDLDDVPAAEPDRSAYAEYADMFDTIASEAARAASVMRRLEAL